MFVRASDVEDKLLCDIAYYIVIGIYDHRGGCGVGTGVFQIDDLHECRNILDVRGPYLHRDFAVVDEPQAGPDTDLGVGYLHDGGEQASILYDGCIIYGVESAVGCARQVRQRHRIELGIAVLERGTVGF